MMMKCKKCGEKASFHMRQHKLALCKAHYLEWIPHQTLRFIERYQMFTTEDRILVAVSGGKDSLALWDVLHGLGFEAHGLYIDLGIGQELAYSSRSRQITEEFASDRNLKLIVYDVAETQGASIPDAAKHTRRGRGKPCSVCGLTKRHAMNSIALREGYSVLATGHNLDDEAAVLFSNTMTWQVGYLQRQGPVLEAREGFVRKVKPFFRFYERETAAYAYLRGIEYMYDECPYAIGATSIYYKEVLNQLEADRPGTKLSFYLAYLKAKETMQFTEESDQSELLHACDQCGQPTSAPGKCAFCRTWNQVRLHTEQDVRIA